MVTWLLQVRGAAGEGQALGKGRYGSKGWWLPLLHLTFWLMNTLTTHKSHPAKPGTSSPLTRLLVAPCSHFSVTRECHGEIWTGCAQ